MNLSLTNMEDCCAVCAEPLEWIGYGLCGHRDVCSLCIARLRFILNDRRCCICKQECPSVFVTKALGDFTKLVGDFESLAERGDLWYESNTQAYFDDEEHYKMIKAMCRLSCSICEQAENVSKESVKKGFVFRNLDLLRRHLLHAHKVQMCDLCLEGRKVFICEQKLYNRVQLQRHASKGDSEVDGNDEERGGFSGHPACDFCRKRFYGDNELYQHMSTEHYTCHICQRLHPARFDYYRNYDDLEAHFRCEHSLCEHPDCLAKKFVVFPSDAELKRHSALNHGGNMSRAQRNAALQIPVSFQYRRPGQDRGGEGPFRHRSYSNERLSTRVQSSAGPNTVEHASEEHLALVSDTIDFPHFQSNDVNVPGPSNVEDAGGESISSSLGNEVSRYRAAVSSNGVTLEEAAFPPLPGSKNARRKAKQRTQGSAVSMASLFRGGDGIRRISSRMEQSQSRSFEREPLTNSTADSAVLNQQSNQWSQLLAGQQPSERLESIRQSSSSIDIRNFPQATGESINGRRLGSGSSAGEVGNNDLVVQFSVEELRTANKALIERIRSELKGDEQRFNSFKDISAQFRKGEMKARLYFEHIMSFGLPHIVPELARLCPDPEKQRDLLEAYGKGMNVKRPSAFNGSSPILVERGNTARSGGSEKDVPKQDSDEEILMQSTVNQVAGLILKDRGGTGTDSDVESLSKDGYRDAKGKKKLGEPSYSKAASSSSSAKRNIGQSKPAKVLVKATQPSDSSLLLFESVVSNEMEGDWTCNVCTLENKEGSSQCAACGVNFSEAASKAQAEPVHEKRKKKTSKFQRARLGDGSAASLFDSRENALGSDVGANGADVSSQATSGGTSIGRGVWKNGGGQRLLSLAQRDSVIESAWNSK